MVYKLFNKSIKQQNFCTDNEMEPAFLSLIYNLSSNLNRTLILITYQKLSPREFNLTGKLTAVPHKGKWSHHVYSSSTLRTYQTYS